MKTFQILMFLAAALTAFSSAQEPPAPTKKEKQSIPVTYAKSDISLIEVDCGDGTLYLTVKGTRMAFIPPAGINKWSPGVLPPLSTDRHARVIECLALQTAINNADQVVVTPFVNSDKVITSLSVVTKP